MVRIGLVLLLCLLLPPAALAQKRVAFVVGIDKYDNLSKDAQLRKAKSDAVAVARVLGGLGFDVLAKDDLTRSAFNNHWQDFLNKLTPGDTAAFYFAGHGVEFAGRNYLLPRDVPNVKPGRDELLRREALSLQEFLTDLRERGTRLNLVILDACRENPFEQMAGRSLGARRGLVIAEPPEGTFIMYSAGAGETALDQLNDADRNANSVYTRNLLPLLRTPGLSLTDVAEQVRVSVRHVAATVRHRQTPAYYNQVLGRVCLAGGDCSQREAAEAWDRTKDTTSTAVLEAFIGRFSGTYYGDLAKVRLAELEQAAKRKAEEDARAKAEAERQRLALLQQEEQRKRADAETSAKQGEPKAAERKLHAAPIFDGQYKARLDCEKLPYTGGPLKGEPVTLTISAGRVRYSRTVYNNNRTIAIGKEIGSGSVAADGTITILGSWHSQHNSFKARYHGKVSEGAATLNGKTTHIYEGKVYGRTCSMTLSR